MTWRATSVSRWLGLRACWRSSVKAWSMSRPAPGLPGIGSPFLCAHRRCRHAHRPLASRVPG
jgi:hypothetical protein